MIETTYDGLRDELRCKLKECEALAKRMMDPTIWGYDDMKKGYDLEVYTAVRKAREAV